MRAGGIAAASLGNAMAAGAIDWVRTGKGWIVSVIAAA